MRIVKRIAISTGIILVVLVTASYLLRHQFEDILKKRLIEAINGQLQTKLYLSEEIEFSVFQKFPYASLKLSKVRADEVNSLNKDTLFWFDNLYFQFNVMDLINKKYDIKKIHADGGFMKLNRNDEGITNFDILRPRKDTGSSGVNLALNDVRLSNVRLVYKDEISRQDIDFVGKEIKLKGLFSADSFDMDIDTDLDVSHYISKSIAYYTGKPAKISLKIAVNSKAGTYKITGGKLELADLRLETSGIITSNTEKDEIDVQITGKSVDLKKVIPLLPSNIQQELGDYKASGKASLDITLKGEIGKRKLPEVIANFSVIDGSLINKSIDVDIRHINLTGSFNNGSKRTAETSQLVLDEFSAELDEGNVTGKFSYSNFKKPEVMLQANAKAKIQELSSLFDIDWIEHPQGLAQIKVSYSGRLENGGTVTSDDIRNGKISGEVLLFDGTFKLKNNQKYIEELNGKLKFNKENLEIEQFSGQYAGSDFNLKGSFKNILPYFIDEGEKLMVKASLTSNKLDLDQLLASQEGGNDSDNGEYSMKFSDRVDFDLKLDVKQLTFRRFEAKEIFGNLTIKDQFLIADNISFNAMQGNVKGKLSLDGRSDNSIPVSCSADIKNIDIHDLFYQCENFTQDFIVEKHLNGRADISLKLNSELKNSLAMDFSKLKVDGDVMIRNGELIEFEPLKELAKFVRLDELEHVKFSELSNHITIKDETVIIPKMEITSSAIDLGLSGEHSFKNDIEYHFRLLLSDVLSKKARDRKPENNEFGVIEDDGRGKTYLFLVMKGTVNDYRIAYDSRAVKDKIKDDLKQERKELKVALNQEFGWFKKDSAVINHKEPEKKAKFTVEWDEEAESKNTEKDKKKSKFRPLKSANNEEENKKKEGSFNVQWE